jgi:hypothetical protein
MYTVIRFMAATQCLDADLLEVGQRLNEVLPGSFRRLDHAGRRFSVTISSADDWGVHVKDVVAFIQKYSAVIAEAHSKNVSTVVDIAVEPEDLGSRPYLSCELSILELSEIAALGVGLVFTFYSPGGTHEIVAAQ